MPRSEAGPAGCKREPRAAAARPPSAPAMLFHASQDSQQQLSTMPRCLNFPAVPHQRIGLQPSRAVHLHATSGTHSCCCHTVTHAFPHAAQHPTCTLQWSHRCSPCWPTLFTFHTQCKNSGTELELAGGHTLFSRLCGGGGGMLPTLCCQARQLPPPRPQLACEADWLLRFSARPLRSPSSRGPRTHCVRAPQAAASPLTDTHHQQAKNQCRCAAGRHPTAAAAAAWCLHARRQLPLMPLPCSHSSQLHRLPTSMRWATLALLFFSGSAALGCTTIGVGKGATDDGSRWGSAGPTWGVRSKPPLSASCL